MTPLQFHILSLTPQVETSTPMLFDLGGKKDPVSAGVSSPIQETWPQLLRSKGVVIETLGGPRG